MRKVQKSKQKQIRHSPAEGNPKIYNTQKKTKAINRSVIPDLIWDPDNTQQTNKLAKLCSCNCFCLDSRLRGNDGKKGFSLCRAVLTLVSTCALALPLAHAAGNQFPLVDNNSLLVGHDVHDLQNGQNTTWFSEVFIPNVIHTILSLAGSIAIIFIIIGGYEYLTAHGEEAKMTSAKKTIIYACVGLLVALFAYIIVDTVINVNLGAPAVSGTPAAPSATTAPPATAAAPAAPGGATTPATPAAAPATPAVPAVAAPSAAPTTSQSAVPSLDTPSAADTYTQSINKTTPSTSSAGTSSTPSANTYITGPGVSGYTPTTQILDPTLHLTPTTLGE